MLGRKIGHYRVTRLIGKGGMGLVYEAVHEEIERRAAIKLLLPQFTNDAEATSRFLNEARAVNIVQHPSLVNIFEFGRLEDGSAFIIMEFLEGETLRVRLARRGGRLGSDSIRIARQIASALAAAHAKKIVHRDLKPANVMLVADPDMVGGERVKVLDFGIAKIADNRASGQVETRTGSVLGSPAYMSPEQCRNVGRVDDRSDVYALGIMLYEMLAGRQPFVSQSDAEIMAMQMYSSPPPLRALAPDVAPDLEALIASMLRKPPGERPAMQDVLATLNRIGGFGSTAAQPALSMTPEVDTSTSASTLSRATGAGTVVRRPRSRTRLGILVSGVLLGVTVSGLWIAQEVLRSRPKPTAPATAADPPRASEAAKNTVHWSLDSQPHGAQVWSAAGDRLLGQTPYSAFTPRDTGVERLLLRLPGYVETVVTLDRGSNFQQMVELVPSGKSADASPRSPLDKNPVASKTAADKGKQKPPGKGSKVKNADILLIH